MVAQVTAFENDRIVARGERTLVTHDIEARYGADLAGIRVFDDATGQVVDLDYWDAAASAPHPEPRARGRPRLGVTAREVTLLPRHWEWLATQPGGASAALRRLVEEARRAASGAGPADTRRRRDAAYRFMSDMCGDRPGYEEALRAMYRGEQARFAALTATWPPDVQDYAQRLLAG
jgi:hypothetical protein